VCVFFLFVSFFPTLSLGSDGKPDPKQPKEEVIQELIDSKNSICVRVDGLLEGNLPVVPESFFNFIRDALDKARKKKGDEKSTSRSKKRSPVEELGHQMEEKHQAAGTKPLAELEIVPPAKKRAKQSEPSVTKPTKPAKADKPDEKPVKPVKPAKAEKPDEKPVKPAKAEKPEKTEKTEKPSTSVKVVKPNKPKPVPVVVDDDEAEPVPATEPATEPTAALSPDMDEYAHPTDRAIIDQLCRVMPLMTDFFAPEKLAKMWATPEAREKRLLNILQRVHFANGVPAFPGADLIPVFLSVFTDPAKEILATAAGETRKKNFEAQRSMSSSTTKGIPPADFWTSD